MTSDTNYTDPCDDILEEDDDGSSGGSGVPPVPSEEGGTEAAEFDYPVRDVSSTGASVGHVARHTRRVHMLDASSFYPAKEYPYFGLGLRVPAELDFSLPLRSSGRLEDPVHVSRARAHHRRETSIRGSTTSELDVPPRDIFRHILGKVWTQETASGQLKYKNTQAHAVKIGGSHWVYDYSRLVSALRSPLMLYLWETIPHERPDGILKHFSTTLGLRFRSSILKEKLSENTRFWRSGEDRGMTDASGEFIAERVEALLDIWTLGPITNTARNKRINPGPNWLIDTAPGTIYEDYVFLAPAAFDFNDEKIEETKTSNYVKISSQSSLSGYLYHQDRAQLKAALAEGSVHLEELTSQPYIVTATSRVNYHSYLHNKLNSPASPTAGETIPNNTSRIQKFNAPSITKLKENPYVSGLNADLDEIMNTHIKIEFTTHASTVASILAGHGLDSMILDVYHRSPNNKEAFTQIIDNDVATVRQTIDPTRILHQDQIKHFTTPKKVKDFIYILAEHSQELNNSQDLLQEIDSHYPLTAGLGFSNSNASITISKAKDDLRTWLTTAERNYSSILDGNKAYSEVIAYKIIKRSVSTGEIIQTFYLYNEQSDRKKITFFDSQVLPRERYEYTIHTISAVLGGEYQYTHAGHLTDQDGARLNYDPAHEKFAIKGEAHADAAIRRDLLDPYYRVNVLFKNHLALIEAPYYQEEISLADYPPTRPAVLFLPEVGTDDRFTILFQPTVGSSRQLVPTPILSSDYEIIQRMSSEQQPDTFGKIKYETFARPLLYELLILDSPPSNYSDFSRGKVTKTSFDEPYLQFKININKNYYLIARSHDRTGISNPTEVHKVRLESHEDGINPIFERYKMSSGQPQPELNFQNMISIEPARQQKKINFSQPIADGPEEDFYNQAPPTATLGIGSTTEGEKLIWGKKFKFRLRSKSSGKSIDINVNYNEKKLESPRTSANSQLEAESGIAATPSSDTYEDISTEQQHRYAAEAWDPPEVEVRESNTQETIEVEPEVAEELTKQEGGHVSAADMANVHKDRDSVEDAGNEAELLKHLGVHADEIKGPGATDVKVEEADREDLEAEANKDQEDPEDYGTTAEITDLREEEGEREEEPQARQKITINNSDGKRTEVDQAQAEVAAELESQSANTSATSAPVVVRRAAVTKPGTPAVEVEEYSW
jgi:hypothetical protein